MLEQCLTNYEGKNISFLDTIGNFCSLPFVTAFGRTVTVVEHAEKDSVLTTQKTHQLAIRIVAAIVSLIIFPVTLVGLAIKSISSDFTINQIKEKISSFFDKNVYQPLHIDKNDEKLTINEKKAFRLVEIANTLYLSLKYKIKINDLQPFFDEFNEIINNFDELKNHFSYEVLLKFKRCLGTLAYYQEHALFATQSNSPNFKKAHQIIRSFYYTTFLTDHLSRNLKEKQQIPALGLKITDLSPVTTNSTTPDQKTILSIIEAIKESFTGNVNPSQVSWVHGTQSATLMAMLKSDKTLKPSGKLRENNELAFCGENDRGCFGINQTRISGVPLAQSKSAIDYAYGGVFHYHDSVAEECRSNPESKIDLFRQKFIGIKEKFENQDNTELVAFIKEFNHSLLYDSLSFYNFFRHLKILYSLCPDLFEKEIIPTINQIIQTLSGRKLSNLTTQVANISKFFADISSFKKNLPVYTEEEKQLIRKGYGVVFGSTNIELVEKKTATSGQKEAEKSYNPNNLAYTEYSYEGTLEMGTDLSFIFVPYEEVDFTRNYLKSKNISNVKVCNFESLNLGSKVNEFKKAKKAPKSYSKEPIQKITV